MWQLPAHFQREQRQLEAAGIVSWEQLAGLLDADLRRLGRSGGASEARLTKLRGQARLVVEVGVEPPEAALLLYAGIANRAGLAEADPHRLLVQMGRLQRSLTGMAAPMVDLVTLQSWIQRARRRPTN
ncbi:MULTISPECIES: DUF4332 domain-containing protein [Synechococcales]|jgi:hypothetical protein|uniref:DUF4332 domain-containing protein n=1 Tax=Synechococcales TaxID=1890424 RepID=UPI000B99D076|nr:MULTISPECIES: DUF4332 domain-containing protein [Synechococcales]MCP9889852.1 DUF4332 domain-containing protein [Cyanobium sp. Aljojuca 7D2]MCP9941233.1 DUF4332 domain-containing protein [Cyanobium sp. ATX 6E8]